MNLGTDGEHQSAMADRYRVTLEDVG